MLSEEAIRNFRHFFQHSRASSGIDNHFTGLQFEVVDIQAGWAHMAMPSEGNLAGNPITGSIAAGPVIALLDTCCAMAAATCGDNIRMSPTLDLRVDFLGPAQAGLKIHAEGRAVRNSRFVVFTEGLAYQENKDRPIARCTINFTPIDHKILQDRKASGSQS